MYKRIICFILILGFTVCFTGQAADDKILFDLKAFGIIKDEVVDDGFLGESMTRAEFVAYSLRLLKYEDILNSMQPSKDFTDVTKDTPYHDYIYAGYTIGILNGYGDGSFRPDEPIKIEEVAKVLACILGYSSMAQQNGGFPSGYIATAVRIGLLKDVSSANPPTRMQVFTAIYNALDIDMMEKQLISNQEIYNVVRGMTFRNQYQNNEIAENIIKGKGVVNADYNFYLNEPITNIKSNQVQIGEDLYYIGKTEPFAFLGLEVEFYYIDDIKTNTQTLVTIKPTSNNSVLELTEDEFARFDKGNVYYYDPELENDREKNVKISQNLRLIKNGVPQASWSNDDIKVESGVLRLIDNDGDGDYNIILREEYSYVTVKDVKADRIIFNENQTFNSMQQLFFEIDDPNMTYVFLNGKGERISYEDIHKENTLSIMANEYHTLYKIIVTDVIIEGEITEIYADKEAVIKIDAERYSLYKNAWRKANVGDFVNAWLNFKGKIIDIELVDSDLQYGYVISANEVSEPAADGSVFSATKGLSDHRVKMIIPGTLVIEYEIDDTNPDNIIKTPYIKGKNSDVIEIKVADNLKKGVLMYTPIRYRLNANGELNYFEKAVSVGVDGKRVYNGYDRTFGARNIGAFATDDKTKILCIPTNMATCSNDDYYAMIDMNNGSEYTINGYDLEENNLAKLAVIHENMEVSSTKGITTKNSKLSVVVSVKNIYNTETEQAEVNIVFYSDGSRKTYKVSENISGFVSSNMKTGDVFYYALNAIGELGIVRIVGSYPEPRMGNAGDANDEISDTSIGKVLFGKIENVKYKELIDAKNKYLDRATIGFGAGEMTYMLDTEFRNPPKIYKVNMSKKTVEIGEREDLYTSSPSNQTYLFAHITGGIVRGIVLYKY